MFLDYLIPNFALLCVSIAMFFIIIYNTRGQKRQNQYSFLIIGFCLILSVISFFELFFKKSPHVNVFMATFFTYLGYIIRPVVVYFFIQLVGKKVKYQWIFYIPLLFNLIIYSFSLFINVEPLQKLVFYYAYDNYGENLIFHRGYLNFTAHVIAGLYALYFLVNAFRGLNNKHKTESVVLFVCALFLIGAVILELKQLATNLLNVTIAISCLFYYLYLYAQQTRKDALTGLYDRKSLYYDVKKFGKSINCMINIDMNGLKYINDHEGHLEGDKAILSLSEVLQKCVKGNAIAYRVGGDEFTIIIVNAKIEDAENIVNNIKEEMNKTKYRVSIGFAYAENKDVEASVLARKADEAMYLDKENFYKTSGFDRRRSHHN